MIHKKALGGALAALILIPAGLFAQSIDGGTTPAEPNVVSSGNAPMPRASKPTSSPDTWNGFYVGAYAGGAWHRATANTSTVFSSTGYFTGTSVPAINTSGRQSLNSTKFNGGGTFGYNHQSGNWVVGAEADFGFLNGTTSATTTTTYPCCSPTTFTVTQSLETKWLFTARPRVGYAWGNTLGYITGGLAGTDLNYKAKFTDTFANAAENGAIDKTIWGWTGGGGFETKVSGDWSVKGEYLYAQFQRQTITSTNLTTTGLTNNTWPQNQFTHSIYLKEHLFRFGINYHF